MHISLESFCEILRMSGRSNAEKALSVLWYFDDEQTGATKSAGQLTRVLDDHHVGTPNQTALARAIRHSLPLPRQLRTGDGADASSRPMIVVLLGG